MRLVLMIAGGVLLAIIALPLLGLALPVAIVIAVFAAIIFSFVYVAGSVHNANQKKKETEERLSKMSEEERMVEIKKIEAEKKNNMMAWVSTGIFAVIIAVVTWLVR